MPSDTPFVPWPHSFASRVWEYQDEPDPPFGELNGPRNWVGGQRPVSAGEGGICGTAEQWAYGCSPSDPSPPLRPGTQIPICCGVPAQRFAGGSGTGGLQPTPLSCCGDSAFPADFWARFESPDAGGLVTGQMIPMHNGPGPCPPDINITHQAHSDPFMWFGEEVRLYYGCWTLPIPGVPACFVYATADCTTRCANTGNFVGTCSPLSILAVTGSIIGGPWPIDLWNFLLIA